MQQQSRKMYFHVDARSVHFLKSRWELWFALLRIALKTIFVIKFNAISLTFLHVAQQLIYFQVL